MLTIVVALYGLAAVAYVVVIIAMLYTVKIGIHKLAAFGVMEHIVMGYTIFGRAAGGGAPQGVIGIAAGSNGGVTAFVDHARKQIPLCLIAEGERHVVGFGECLQQVRARQVGIGKELLRPAMYKACGSNTAIRTVAGGYRLLHRAILGIGVACGAPVRILQLGDKMRFAACQQRIRRKLAVSIVRERALPGSICNREQLPQVVVGIGTGSSGACYIRVCGTQQQAAGMLVGVSLGGTSSIGFRKNAVKGIVSFGNALAVCVRFADFHTRGIYNLF